MMGLEPTTFCMANKIARNDLERRETREAAFLHGLRGCPDHGARIAPRAGFGRLGH
jgi:hypothetical protein